LIGKVGIFGLYPHFFLVIQSEKKHVKKGGRNYSLSELLIVSLVRKSFAENLLPLHAQIIALKR